MHTIEPFYGWLNDYDSSEDENSPFEGEEYSEFYFSKTVYNYYIHPRWDDFGSNTLYAKILYADYDDGYTIIELIGEWNDCLYNDFMTMKRNLIEPMINANISKFILICENVLNFHGSDSDYYEELAEELDEYEGWIIAINCQKHIVDEMDNTRLFAYLNYKSPFNNVNWRPYKPGNVYKLIDSLRNNRPMRLS